MPVTHTTRRLVKTGSLGFFLGHERMKILTAVEPHRAYVASTWAHQAPQLARRHRANLTRVFCQDQMTQCDIALGRGDVHVLVPSDEPNCIAGWVAFRSGCVLMAYTPPELRKLGIMSGICGEFGVNGERPVCLQRLPFKLPEGWVYL